MTSTLYEQCRLAVHVIAPDGQQLRGGQACLYILAILGYRRTAEFLGCWPLCWLVDVIYWTVARYRTLFSRILFPRN